MVYNEYNTLNIIICLCTKTCINCDFEVYYHNIIPQYKTVKHYTYTHAVHNKTTISLNSSILKNENHQNLVLYTNL